MSAAIAEEFRAGVPFEDILEMNVAIKQRDLGPYAEHRRRLDSLLWYDAPLLPKGIIELGAGYGAMAGFWPPSSLVFNVDLPEMLEVQASYLLGEMGCTEHHQPRGFRGFEGGKLAPKTSIILVPFTLADAVPFDGNYLFSTWALTETTPETWKYYIEKAPRLAGVYLVGWRTWIDRPGELWPWEAMRDAFMSTRSNLAPYVDHEGRRTDSVELAAVNR